MGEAVRSAVKAPETKKENHISQVQKGNLYQPVSSHVEKILFLQRTIGNQAVERLLKSGAIQTKFKIVKSGLTEKVMQKAEKEEKKGGRHVPAFDVTIAKIKDADPLPGELQNKLKAYILISYSPSDPMYTLTERGVSEKESIKDEIETLKNKGYVVIINELATEKDIINAFNDPDAEFILTIGHGDPPGTVRDVNGESVEPAEINIPAGSNMKEVIFENCYIGDDIEKWKKVLGEKVEVVSWEGKMDIKESIMFNSSGGFSDRQWGSLMSRVKSLHTLKNQKGDIYSIKKPQSQVQGKKEEIGDEKPMQPKH
jgi:hypothetical protein